MDHSKNVSMSWSSLTVNKTNHVVDVQWCDIYVIFIFESFGSDLYMNRIRRRSLV